MHHRRTFISALLLLGLITGCSRDPNVRKQKYLESGQRYFEKNKYREAAIQFANAIQVDSRFADAHYQLAQVYLKLQDTPRAYQELARTVELQPDHTQARTDLANLLIAGNELDRSEEQLDLLAPHAAGSAKIQTSWANYYSARGDNAAALQSMQRALQLDGNNSDLFLNMALLQLRASQLDAAETSFRKAVELNPRSTGAQLALGSFYQARSRWNDAEQTFLHAIELDPQALDARAAMARLYLAQGRHDDAEQFLKQIKRELPQNSAADRMLGDFYLSTGNLDKAVEEYSSLYKSHPADLQVKKNYIQLLILHDQIDPAARLNDEVLQANPRDVQCLIYRGQIQLHQGKSRDAAETLQAAIKTAPDSAVAHYHLGVALDGAGNSQSAENEWQTAIRLQPGMIEAHRALAQAELRRDNYTALQQSADALIKLTPQSADGYIFHALAAEGRKDYSTAEADLKQAIDVAPQNPAGYVEMGNLRLTRKKYADAEKSFEAALDRNPASVDALAGLSRTLVLQKRADKAASRINAQIAKVPNNASFYSLLGMLLWGQKNYAGAETALKKATGLNKNDSNALLMLGQVQSAAGRDDDALATLENATRDAGAAASDARFYILAGEIHEAKHEASKAQQLYERALQVHPENPQASNNLARLLLEEGSNVDVAFSHAQIARRGMPESPIAADTLGMAFLKKNDYSSAADLFKEAIRRTEDLKNPGDADYFYHLALAYEKLGQREAARAELEKALKANPNFAKADDARKLLAQFR